MRQEIRLWQGAVVAVCLVAIGVMLSCGGSNGALAVQPPGIPTIYGDGSAGAFSITSGTGTGFVAGNTQFTNISITGAGTVAFVESGTVLHCTGTFTIGPGATLTVKEGALGGAIDIGASAASVSVETRPAMPGVGKSPAGSPRVSGTGEFVLTVAGGIGLDGHSRHLRYAGHHAGGSGGGAYGASGGSGGGGLTVLAFGGIQIDGTLQANGAGAGGGGAGGGAGGVVVLASATGIVTSGTVIANGGAGGPSQNNSGAGGGGGGGIINLLAPNIVGVNGANYVALAGAPGSNGGLVSGVFRSAGGSGGGCAGNGGYGGSVDGLDNAGPALAGGAGRISHILVPDPAGLFP